MMNARNLIIVLFVVIAAVLLWRYFGAPGEGGGKALAEVTVPSLSATAREGEALFNANCAACHGRNAAGVDGAGPPLIHIIYEPGHHPDGAFHSAVRNGVRSHHWQFGNMAPVEGVGPAEVDSIVAYIRQVQRANGIR
ncbi:MAG: c-type cytochrome [Flavobacteriaceae bacterium]